jgi:type VI protein secretion system component VasK
MKSLRRAFLAVLAIFALAVIAGLIPPLKQLTEYLNGHPQPYQGITIGTAILGWILFAGAIAYSLWTRGKPMSDNDSLSFMEQSASSPTIHRRFSGRAKGREFRTEVSFREIKEAWQNGDWRHERVWAPIFLGLSALALKAFGMFGFFFVIGTPFVKLICGGALLYATVRTVWAF